MARSESRGELRLDRFADLGAIFGFYEWRNYFNRDTRFDPGRPNGRHAWLVFGSPDRALQHGVPASTKQFWGEKKGLEVPDHANHHLDGAHNQHCFKKRGQTSYVKFWEQRPLLATWESGLACTEPNREWAEEVRKLANLGDEKA